MFDLKKENYNDAYWFNLPVASKIKMSKNFAYVHTELFRDWLENHLYPRKPPGNILLISDRHLSHLNVDTLDFASAHNIEFLCLPTHCTHNLQPLDRSFFKQLKCSYNKVTRREVKMNKPHRVTRYTFGRFLVKLGKKQQRLSMVPPIFR